MEKRARLRPSRSATVRAKLTAYAIRHARTQLRAAGIRPPTNHEALLAAHLDQQLAPRPQPPALRVRMQALATRRPSQ